MTQNITINAPIKTVSEANRRDHWAARARRAKKQRSDAFYAVKAAGFKFQGGRLVVFLTRFGRRTLDDDNLARSLKSVRDGVADALKVDDGDPRIGWVYFQAINKKYSVEIDIWPEGCR